MDTTDTERTTVHVQRIDRLRAELDAQGWSGLLVLDVTDVRYLTGLKTSNAAFVVTPTSAVLATDFRYVAEALDRASRTGGAFEVFQVDQGLYGEIGRTLEEWTGGGAIAYSPTALSHRAFLQLTEELSGDVTLRAAEGVVARLREVKDDDELDAIRRAAALLERAYGQVVADGLVGRTEREVAWSIERLLRESGAEAMSFDAIVAGGANGAFPHHTPGDDAIPANVLVTIDIGCVVDGYCSDCTRTFATGTLDDELARIYDVTLRAQVESLAAVRAGAVGRDVDAIARDIITEAGYGERFGHGLGHGVGMLVHEGPRLARTSDAVLAERSVVTVEPGIYVPGLGGVRIEDLVVVTADGCEVLTCFPKTLTNVEE